METKTRILLADAGAEFCGAKASRRRTIWRFCMKTVQG